MSRNGSGVYSLPAGTTAVLGEDILPGPYNSALSDLESDANTARPVSAGGTGATTEAAARTALAVPHLLSGMTTAPGANDDGANTGGNGTCYVGTVWADETADAIYICVDATTSNAVWTEVAPASSISAGEVGTTELADDAVTFAKIADAALSGADATLVTGTAGTANTAAMWNADGDLIEATATAGDALPLTAPGGSGNLAASVDTLGELVTAVDTLATGGGGFQSVQIFTSSGTWTRPAGITKVTIAVTGGGGGGGDTSSEIGGGAATVWKYALDVSAIASSTITIGAGGAGDSGSGSNGGSSSWADGTNTISADGGRSGSGLDTLVTGTGGDIVMARRASEDGKSSYWGTGGEDDTAGQNAPATSYGAGGGAVTGSNSNSGGDGADGVVVVWEFA